MPTEFDQLKSSIKDLDGKVNRLLSWAEGDQALGTPSLKQQMEQIERETVENRRRAYDNRNSLSHLKRDVDTNTKDIKGIKKSSVMLGAGSGGGVFGILELIRSFFTP